MDLDKIKEAIDSVRSFYEEQCIFMKRFGYGGQVSPDSPPTTSTGFSPGPARIDAHSPGIQRGRTV